MLSDYNEPDLDEDADQAMREYMARRKDEEPDEIG